jgi:hypothetical protein
VHRLRWPTRAVSPAEVSFPELATSNPSHLRRINRRRFWHPRSSVNSLLAHQRESSESVRTGLARYSTVPPYPYIDENGKGGGHSSRGVGHLVYSNEFKSPVHDEVVVTRRRSILRASSSPGAVEDCSQQRRGDKSVRWSEGE